MTTTSAGVSPHALRRFIGALLRASPQLTAKTVLLTIGVGLFEGVGLLLLLPLLQLIGLDTGQRALGGVFTALGRGFAFFGLAPTLPVVLALYVAVMTVQSELQRQQSIVSTALRLALVHDLRERMYRAIAGASWLYFSRQRASAFLQILTDRVDRVAGAAFYLVEFGVSAVVALVYFAMAFRVSPIMTAAISIAGGGLAVAFRWRVTKARAVGRRYSDAGGRLHTATSDFLASMKIAKGYGAERRHVTEFVAVSQHFSDSGVESMRESSKTRHWLAVGSAAGLALMVYASHALLHITAASLFLLMFLFARLVPRVTGLYDKAHSLVIELPQFEIVEAAERGALENSEPVVAEHRPIVLTRGVDVRDVSFSYSEDGVPLALEGVTMSCAARATTAIVGPSGAGKSTLADLLMGLVPPSSGALLVDGVPLTAEYLQSWRDQIGYVPQDTLIFHDTILANLRWASPGASEGEVWRALEMAAADEFVRRSPHGLHTVLGDRGVLISGGERQRLSLARALLRQPRLLILDEATSSLDSENERRIQGAIERLHEQITIVVITHRLSMIRNADVIHVMDRGRVVESGQWESLLAAGGRFRALCDAQGLSDSTLLIDEREVLTHARAER